MFIFKLIKLTILVEAELSRVWYYDLQINFVSLFSKLNAYLCQIYFYKFRVLFKKDSAWLLNIYSIYSQQFELSVSIAVEFVK